MRRAIAAITVLAAFALVFAAGAPAHADPGNGNGNGQGNPPGHAGGQGNNGNGGGNGSGGGSAAGNDGSPNGANGTVKIHDWPEHKNSSDMANDPKVCQFEIHGFKFDPGQSDDWWIQAHKWGNGDKTKSVLGGSYTANSSGDWTSGPHSLADGHYKLFVEMSHHAGNSGNTVVTYKHKVFKVDCPPPGGGELGEARRKKRSRADSRNRAASSSRLSRASRQRRSRHCRPRARRRWRRCSSARCSRGSAYG